MRFLNRISCMFMGTINAALIIIYIIFFKFGLLSMNSFIVLTAISLIAAIFSSLYLIITAVTKLNETQNTVTHATCINNSDKFTGVPSGISPVIKHLKADIILTAKIKIEATNEYLKFEYKIYKGAKDNAAAKAIFNSV